MIRMSEMVLPGHPDKFCDQVADAIVERCAACDPEAYCQVEVAAWRDQVWISGGMTLPEGEEVDTDAVVAETASRIGYRAPGGGTKRFSIIDRICRMREDPRAWSHHVNDQAICMGWAGYDSQTRWLPPEHYLAHRLREALATKRVSGCPAGYGPDGKLLLTMAEEGDAWRLESILATVEQAEDASFPDLIGQVESRLRAAYESIRAADPRWVAGWDSVRLSLNPNGPLVDAGTESDNGQTGRKLAMDYYGPRIGQGGGALSGKHLSHIDRLGAYAARQAALDAVRSGARSCRILLAYAPNYDEPLEMAVEAEGRCRPLPAAAFRHSAMRARMAEARIVAALGEGSHFWDREAPWNR